eukprot:3076594-Amphidinium_carterae.5
MSCCKSKVPSMRLQPPGFTLQMEGPGFLASPMRQLSGCQPFCRYPKQAPLCTRSSGGLSMFCRYPRHLN